MKPLILAAVALLTLGSSHGWATTKTLTIVNDTSVAIERVTIRKATHKPIGRIGGGKSKDVKLEYPDGLCLMDIRTVFADGDVLDEKFNFCIWSVITYRR